MKNIKSIIGKSILAIAAIAITSPCIMSIEKSTGWGDFKLFLDPGHSGRENRGLWGYSEAQKVLSIALTTKEYLLNYTDMPAENIKLCRKTEAESVSLEERSDMANAWGADFYYSIHSDASATVNTTVTLFGGWRNNGVEVEKTPNGGKAFGEFLNPNLTGVMRITTRGNWYDRCYYDRSPQTHANQYPYLSVNRRSNMASLLSEGGYHTIASQQQLNINKDYKRLEAFAAFQSILSYRNMTKPAQTFLAGIITNSENEVPIDGVTVEVDGLSYTTDTWESVFKDYTSNRDLIHNGFYLFENLEAGKTVEVKFSAPGFDTVTKTTTIKSNPEGQSNDNITWLDIAMTSNAPAKIATTSIENPESVTPVYPIILTFSRKMDKQSVEKAFSISNNGEVALTWTNDYTLSIDVSKLVPLSSYTITIDGSIAKNSQTGQLFDGNGDGIGGDNYSVTITMAEPDVTPANVVSTDPAINGEVKFTLRPVVRIEYDEILDWNDDKYGNSLTVTDKDNNEYEGVLTHTIINEASVLHFFFKNDLPLDKCFIVKVKGGIADLSGNLTDDFSFKFLSEYRDIVSTEVLHRLNDVSGFWAPDGSGSSSGLTQEANSWTATNIGVRLDDQKSVKLKYDFDKSFNGGLWQIREYHSMQNITRATNDGVLTFWLYGDGSNNSVSTALRVRTGNKNGGIKYNLKPIDFRGWHLISWDLKNDSYEDFTGVDALAADWRLDSFFFKHINTDNTPDAPQQAWKGEVCFDLLEFTKFNESAVRTASFSDITGVEEINSANDAIKVITDIDNITVFADTDIATIDIYSIAGAKVITANPLTMRTSLPLSNLESGLYIVSITTVDGSSLTKKFIK